MSEPPKPHKPLVEPREMRKLLDEVAYGHRNIDGTRPRATDPYGMAANLTRQCFDAARYIGLSGEDRMTMLAYQALLAYEKMAAEYIHSLNITSRVPFVVPHSEGKDSGKPHP